MRLTFFFVIGSKSETRRSAVPVTSVFHIWGLCCMKAECLSVRVLTCIVLRRHDQPVGNSRRHFQPCSNLVEPEGRSKNCPQCTKPATSL